MAEEEEYEVESILRARVDRSRGKQSLWKYHVKWKGYSQDDNTWEPEKSFEGGAEQIIERFWDRADTGGRDIADLSLFKVGEEFYPIGPPRRKGKRKGLIPENVKAPSRTLSQSEVDSARSGKRQRTSPDVLEENRPFIKRKREFGSDHASKLMADKKNKHLPYSSRNNKELAPRRSSSSKHNVLPESSSEDSEDEIMRDYLVEPSDILQSDHQNSKELHPEKHLLSKRVKSSQFRQEDHEASADDQQLHRSTLQSDDIINHDSPLFGDSDCDSSEQITQNTEIHQSPVFVPLSASTSSIPPSSLPSHRARAANPLVKMVDGASFQGMQGAIKARFLQNPASTSSPVGPSVNGGARSLPSHPATAKPGPVSSRSLQKKNVSSLLTFQKGSLQTVKGKYSLATDQQTIEGATMENISRDNDSRENINIWGDEEAEGVPEGDVIPGLGNFRGGPPAPPQPVPTGPELLQLAGLDTQVADTLPDFDDEPPTEATDDPVDKGESVLQQSLELAKDKLFPTGSSSASATNTLGAAWQRSTIFGPLGLGIAMPLSVNVGPVSDPEAKATRPPFFLTLDSSVSVPVVLKDISSQGTPSLDFIIGKSPKGPPGQFYHEPFALALLETLRTGGSSARIAPDTSANENQKQHFERFRTRLESGELFVAMAGVEVLAFCSSQNALLCQRLGVPSMLIGLPNTVLVSRVVIENYSAYGDAAFRADSVRW